MKKGFTLIELMIVVAIIAIIAAIAIPNLLESKIQANETNAVAALKQYGTAQNTYMKANYSNIPANLGQPKMYTNAFTTLGGAGAHQNAAGTLLTLIPAVFAEATQANGFQGYFFTDDANVTNWTYEYGLYADPCLYEKSGNNSYHIGTQGTVVMDDLAGANSGGNANVSTWTVP